MSNKIFNLSEAASIAIHSMVYVAQNNKMTNVIKISEHFHFSKHHVAKVMQRLTKAGMIKSNRGPSGGVVLAMDPKDISLLDIYEVIEGKILISDCPMGYEFCSFNKCLFGPIVNDMTKRFKEYLQEKNIQYFLDNDY